LAWRFSYIFSFLLPAGRQTQTHFQLLPNAVVISHSIPLANLCWLCVRCLVWLDLIGPFWYRDASSGSVFKWFGYPRDSSQVINIRRLCLIGTWKQNTTWKHAVFKKR
jgi:hypothetical protein